MGTFEIDKRVIVDANALKVLLRADMKPAERNAVLTDVYFVTGVGKKCIGIKSARMSRSINIKKGDAVQV